MRRVYVDENGEEQSLRGRICSECPRHYTCSQRCMDVVRIIHRCELTGGKVNPLRGACILYPLQVGWRVGYA